jgi:catechol 2,3-dioxygenase-like lactoylglutathione lyase family enzyme
MFHGIDCLQFPVPDLEAALVFYRDRLGHASGAQRRRQAFAFPTRTPRS